MSSSSSEASSSQTAADSNDHSLQPFFVLHRAVPKKPERKDLKPSKSRKITATRDQTPPSKLRRDSDAASSEGELDDSHYTELRLRAFNTTWSKIESTVQNALRQINHNLFEEVRQWIVQAFAEIESARGNHASEIARLYPVIDDVIQKQIPAALIHTRNMESVDDSPTFQELGVHLKSNGCHVAHLSSLDFMTKNGLGGCLKSLLRQLLEFPPDVADISVLASWHRKQENCHKPLVLIIDDVEQCNGPVFGEFILLLSEWVIKIPVIVVLGIATNINIIKKLCSNALKCLQACKFISESPHERIDSIIDLILAKPDFGFTIGYEVAHFMRNYFLRHDGTVTSFMKALKIACAKHFFMEPLSFIAHDIYDEDDKDNLEEKFDRLPKKLLDYASSLPSSQGEKCIQRTGATLLHGLLELKRCQKSWSSILMCLIAVEKFNKNSSLNIFCEASNPMLYKQHSRGHSEFSLMSNSNSYQLARCVLGKGSMYQVIQRIRELSSSSLIKILNQWSKHTECIPEVHNEVVSLMSLLRSTDDKTTLSKEGLTNSSHKCMRRTDIVSKNEVSTVNEKVAVLLESMVRDYLKPPESVPFHEIFCFKSAEMLQEALLGDSRSTIQRDLLKSCSYIKCTCCKKDEKAMSPNMHDTSIIYNLSQEHGDLINLCDWYASFKAILQSRSAKSGCKTQVSRAAKANDTSATNPTTESSIQARFCRAVMELQITGLIRMASKRRPDYLQRVAFGI